MKPYYESGGVRIFHGDALEVMGELLALPEGERPDLVVTDPPYGIRDKPLQASNRTLADGSRVRRVATTRHRGALNTWHEPSEWDRELRPEWIARALDFGPVALFGHWRKRTAFEAAAGMEPRCEIVWAKDSHVGPPTPVAMRDERVWIFGRKAIKPLRFETSVWDSPCIPPWVYRFHKNEKPLRLMVRLVSFLPGALVLDPFMGSGTTLRAAKDLGRRAIGIEANERHCERAVRRLAQEVLDFEPERIQREPLEPLDELAPLEQLDELGPTDT